MQCLSCPAGFEKPSVMGHGKQRRDCLESSEAAEVHALTGAVVILNILKETQRALQRDSEDTWHHMHINPHRESSSIAALLGVWNGRNSIKFHRALH